jgi:hypothetical protein
MSNDRKNAINEHGSADDNDADPPSDATRETGQSQDASRHQQDAAHHKGHKTSQKDADGSEAKGRHGPKSDP